MNLKDILKNKYLKEYGRLLIVALIGLIGGILFLIYNHHEAHIKAVAAAQVAQNTAVVKPHSSPWVITQPNPTTPVLSTPTPASTTQNSEPNTAWGNDNSVQCASIAATGNANLTSLQSQIVQQLQIMKAIIGNGSIDSEILSYGGSLNSIVGQSQITESFNQADASATALINQLSSDKETLIDQLTGLDNGNSPGCITALKPLLGE